jgi:anti-sigma28 factor (negative regulator of flagellin synthesis)
MKRPKRRALAQARRTRVLQLRQTVRAGLYDVPAKTVATAILRQLGLGNYAPAHQQR